MNTFQRGHRKNIPFWLGDNPTSSLIPAVGATRLSKLPLDLSDLNTSDCRVSGLSHFRVG